MALAIKADDKPAWEYAAALAGLSVTQLAQKHLDTQGEMYAAQMRAADRDAQAGLFALALQLTPAARDELKAKVLELAAAEGLPVPAEG
jgi:hypothetical protein